MLLEVLLGKSCLQRHPEVASGAQKQKFRLGCNFFAIRDCCKLINRGLLPKKAAKMAVWRLIAALSGWKGAPNRKNVAKKSRFLFSQQVDCYNGTDSAKNVRGQWRQRGGSVERYGVATVVERITRSDGSRENPMKKG